MELQHDFEAFSTELRQLRADVEKAVDTLRETARHGQTAAAEKLQTTGEQLFRRLNEKSETVTKAIKERPVTSALIAFGVGALIGKILAKRR